MNKTSASLPILVAGVILGAMLGTLVTSVILFGVLQVYLMPLRESARRTEGIAVATVAPTPVAQPVAAMSGDATKAVVRIAGFAFEPHTLIVATGAAITWRNEDGVPHTVTSLEGWFDSGQLQPGASFTWQPNKPGVFRYHCGNHPDKMEGVLIVQVGGAVAPAVFNGKPVQEVFRDACGGCHGPNREGGTGPALIPERLTEKDEFYFKTIKEGRPGTVMPAWGGLSDEEIWALVGFIKGPAGTEAVRWGLEEIAKSRQVLIPEEQWPDKPQHSHNLDNLMLVTERENRSIAVFDGDTNELIGHIPASYRAHGYAFDPTNPRWVYNVGRDGWLFKIDLYSLKPVIQVRVGQDSRGLAVSDDGRYVIAGNYIPNSAVILDAKTLQPLKVIETEGKDPDGKVVKSRVCIVSDVSPKLVGPYFIIALKEAGQMWRIDWSKPDFPIDKVENVGRILHDGFLSPDNRRFYVASQKDNWMAVIDVAEWKLVDKISTGAVPHPGSGATWEEGGRVYGATVHAGEGKVTVWDLADNKIVAEIPTSGPGLFIRSHEDNPYIWADALFGKPANHIYVIDRKTFQVVKVINDGIQTLHPEFTADGKYVYVADWQGNMVRIYDAHTLTLVKEVGGVTTPTGIFSVERRLETLGH